MACFHPIRAWVSDGVRDGKEAVLGDRERRVVFRESPGRREIRLPCGVCVGCRHVRVRSWALRCMCESQMHAVSSFVTLTYGGEVHPSLNYSDFQHFMYRVRRYLGATRFFMCGEYGELNKRPHFHALLFGRTFDRWFLVKDNVYASRTLAKLWPHGHSSFGEVSYASAAYVASYASKKVSSRVVDDRYKRVDLCTGEIISVAPEFGHMSLKPGIGATWFEKYWREVASVRDGVVQKGGRVMPSPRYFDKLLERSNWDLKEANDVKRYLNAAMFVEDNSPARLLVREECAIARNNMKQRFL